MGIFRLYLSGDKFVVENPPERLPGNVGGNIKKMKTKLTLNILTLMLMSIQLFSQSTKNDTEFYFQLGTNNGFRFNNPINPSYEFQTNPILFLGYGINEFSTQFGFGHHTFNHFYSGIVCFTYPCPNAIDFKSIEFFFDLKYKFLDNEKLELESVLSFNSEIIYYQLNYYKNNKENENWISEQTPYLFYPINLHSGFNLDYVMTKRISLFITPMLNLGFLRPFTQNIISKDHFKIRTGIEIKLKK